MALAFPRLGEVELGRERYDRKTCSTQHRACGLHVEPTTARHR